jgi:hypothetical protein
MVLALGGEVEVDFILISYLIQANSHYEWVSCSDLLLEINLQDT